MAYYILETNYYTSTWVWFKRLAALLVALIVFFSWDFSDMPPYGQFAVYVGFILILTALFLSPIDDLAVDNTYLYHIRTSFLPLFSRTHRYEISTLSTIRCVGVHVPGPTIREMTTRRYQGGYTNTIEMSFKDTSYKSFEAGVYKEDILEILLKVQELMKPGISQPAEPGQ
jgi:hypothetical protein